MSDLLKAGFIWTPRYGNAKPDMSRCRASVSDGSRMMSWHQCTRKMKVEHDVDDNGKAVRLGYCAIHDPVAIKAKNVAQRAKWDAEWKAKQAASDEAKRRADSRPEFVAALIDIACGHNDPRARASEVLAKWGERIEHDDA